MVLNDYREQADKLILPAAKKMSSIEPNTLSWIALIFAFLAGLTFYLAEPYLVLLGGLFIVLNSFFDAMDGRVAKLTGKASKMGDFLDHTLDRYADILIIGGIILGPLCRLWIGLFGIVGVLMTSYMGTQAHAVGVSRNYGGVAGRADRLILLILFSLLYLPLYSADMTTFAVQNYTFSLFDLLLVWFALAGNLTAFHRAVSTWKELKKDKE